MTEVSADERFTLETPRLGGGWRILSKTVVNGGLGFGVSLP